jgi:alpha-ketoglutarate-dependent taurine dioxygenase
MNYMVKTAYSADAGFPARLRELVRTNKVVHLHGVPEQADLGQFYYELAQQVGRLTMRNESVETKGYTPGQWMDIRYDAGLSKSFRHANTRQPLHTDGSYIADDELFDVVFLFCTVQAKRGGATTFVDADVIVDYLRDYDAGLLHDLETVKIRYERGIAKLDHRTTIEYAPDGILMNWNYFPIAPDLPPGERELVERFHAFLEERIVAGGLTQEALLQPGDAVFFHDRRVLHGRNSFWGDRCLLKGGIFL